jgi:hypothetical protein
MGRHYSSYPIWRPGAAAVSVAERQAWLCTSSCNTTVLHYHPTLHHRFVPLTHPHHPPAHVQHRGHLYNSCFGINCALQADRLEAAWSSRAEHSAQARRFDVGLPVARVARGGSLRRVLLRRQAAQPCVQLGEAPPALGCTYITPWVVRVDVARENPCFEAANVTDTSSGGLQTVKCKRGEGSSGFEEGDEGGAVTCGSAGTCVMLAVRARTCVSDSSGVTKRIKLFVSATVCVGAPTHLMESASIACASARKKTAL